MAKNLIPGDVSISISLPSSGKLHFVGYWDKNRPTLIKVQGVRDCGMPSPKRAIYNKLLPLKGQES